MNSRRQQKPTRRSGSLSACAASVVASLLALPALCQTVTGDVRIHGYVEPRCGADYIGDAEFSGTIDFATPARADVPAAEFSPLAPGGLSDAPAFLVACSVGIINITISATRRGEPQAADATRAVRFQINLNAFDHARVASVTAVCDEPASGAEGYQPCASQGGLVPPRQPGNATINDAGAHWQVSAPVRAGINTLIPSLSTIDTLTLTLSAAR